ncbi:MAG: DUF86 domain-containing protein [Candidatus Hydrogenedentes bacterium]|nr:DUF86 domain-containing protein [Candidatus Hydrogenedentota bacterium]
MFEPELVRDILVQRLQAAKRIEQRIHTIHKPDDFRKTDAGEISFDAIAMLLSAIGESLKKLDRLTDGKFLSQYPSFDWKAAKGLRDVISHNYFDLDREVIFRVCKFEIPTLFATLEKMIEEVS